MIEKIFDRILTELKGSDLWFVLALAAITVVGWYWLGAEPKASPAQLQPPAIATAAASQPQSKEESKPLPKQIGFAVSMVLLGLAVVGVRRWIAAKRSRVPQGVAGIVVMRIKGDDANHSLQTELVSTLNTALHKESPNQNTEVRAGVQEIDEGLLGMTEAHRQAREIGRKLRALLVVWGSRVADKKAFHPRITLVSESAKASLAGERPLAVQNIGELSLPEELVDQPIYLAHFVAGYSFYDRNQYTEALRHFQLALQRKTASPAELADLKFFAGTSHWYLAQGQRTMESHLRQAIGFFEDVAGYYQANDSLQSWAATQNNLGVAYRNLPTGDRAENLKKAIAAYEAALRVYTEKDFPADWAMTQNNLGNAYGDLPTGDRAENLKKAIAAYEAALRVYTEKDFPANWATTQNNLGIAYADLPTGDRAENLKKAIAAFEAALRVRTEKDFPADWAMTQNNLGIAYADLPTGDRAENLKKAIAAFEAALRVYTEKDFPADWAMTQNNLGIAYADLPTGDRAENFRKAVASFENALKIFTASSFPHEHRNASANLEDVKKKLASLEKK